MLWTTRPRPVRWWAGVGAVTAALAVGLVAGPLPAGAAHAAPAGGWIGTWAASPSGKVDNGCTDCTIRDVVHTTLGGTAVRVHLSNVFGTAPLPVAHTTVALPVTSDTAEVAPGTLREVRFDGRAAVTIPPGRSVVSDPVRLPVPAASDLLVTTFTPGYATPMTYHPLGEQDSFFTSGTDRADATSASAFPQTTGSWHFLTGVDVAGSRAAGDVVTFGDSITDGWQSTPNLDHRWPDILAGRLRYRDRGPLLGVLNAGISGNRILLAGGESFGPSALSRLDRDVLDQPGARTVIVLLGINDIQQTPHQLDPAAIIAGLRQIADRAHRAGLRVIGGTLLPFEGWVTYDQQEEQTRQAVNAWIRTTGSYDGVVDFDAAVRDPADPHRMLPAYDSGDHLHPNDLGYATMGAAVDLDLL